MQLMYSSIRTFMIVTLSIAVVFSSFWVLRIAAFEHKSMYIDEQKEQLFAMSKSMTLQLLPILEQSSRKDESITKALSQVEYYSHVIRAAVYDANFNLVQQFSDNHLVARQQIKVTPNEYEFGITLDGGTMFSFERIGSQSFPAGYLFIIYQLEHSLEDSQHNLFFNVIPWLFLVLMATILLSIALLNRALGPLEKLTRFTQKINETKDYTARNDIEGTAEIKRLSLQINRLMSSIEDEMAVNLLQTQTLIEQQAAMKKLANFDNLTGLPNRQFVMDTLKSELTKIKRQQRDLILLFFDLDGFKSINDSLGHETGDRVLLEVAERVKGLLREDDVLARLGGDEFIIITDRKPTMENIATISERILSAFIEPFNIRGLSLHVGGSIGIACAKGANYDINQWISNADLAMYRAKAKSRGSYSIFDPAMSEGHKRKMIIADSIETAIAENHFQLYYQHKVNSQGDVDSLEALIRWLHPELGEISPNEFIAIAEYSGKISQITRWVLKQACFELSDLIKVYGSNIRVAINLSAHDLRQKEFFDWVYDSLSNNHTNPENIEFEVTESAYLDDFANSERLFKRLHNLGCIVALDDFGTGYSSLSYLTQITIDTLKIDRQFVAQLEHSQKCKLVTLSIIDLAKRLGLRICAEGVESQVQWDYLCAHGCDSLQGYLLSRPAPLSDILSDPLSYRSTLILSEQYQALTYINPQ